MKRISYQSLNNDYGHATKLGELLAEKQTKYQHMELYNSPFFGKLLILDNVTQVSESSEHYYHEPMAHIPLLQHPHPKKVLIIGGGDGGLLREVLKHKVVEEVLMVELDGDVVEFTKEHMPSIPKDAWKDPRAKLVIQDGRGYLEAHTDTYDVIIMDMTDPFGPSMALYTKEFYNIIKAHLNAGGLFFMHSESPILTPYIYASINKTLNAVFNHTTNYYTYIQMYGGLWSFALNSMDVNVNATSMDVFKNNITKRGLNNLRLITAETIGSMKVEYPEFTQLKAKQGMLVVDGYNGFDEINPEHLLFYKD